MSQFLVVVMVIIAIMLPSTSASAATSNLIIDASQTYQVIDGMGVNINVKSWDDGLLKPALDSLINISGCSHFRVYKSGTDWVNSESLIPALHDLDATTLQQVYETPDIQDIWNVIGYLNEKGVGGDQIILSFQNWLPTWLGGSGVLEQPSYITPGKEPQFATMLASLVYYGRRVKDLDFTIIAPTNEPALDGLEGPLLSPEQNKTVFRAIVDELDYMGLSEISLVGPNTYMGGSYGRNDPTSVYISALMSDSIIASRINHFAVHEYWQPASLLQPYPNTNYWLTETGGPCHPG